jgi:GWxTD domain-containing protein
MAKRLITLGAVVLLLAFALPTLAAGKGKDKKKADWGESPEAYFLTATERQAWLSAMLNEASADKFIADYWAAHGEGFHKEVLARIAAADKYFGLPDRKGSETEKGRVWMILGSPSQQFESRNSENRGPQPPSAALGNFGANNSLEAQARTRTTWVYKKDRLPQALGAPEMTVTFQTDVSRGLQTIENPGLIEPYLHKAVDYMMSQQKTTGGLPGTPTEQKAAVGVTAPAFDSMLWTAADKLNGAAFTGEPFVSPTEKTFYAVSFYLPKATFADAKEVVVAGSVRDNDGKEVATVHQKVPATDYDNTGDKYADVSVELPAGKYTGVFALYGADEKTLLANTRATIDVPAADATRVSPLLLTSHIDELQNQQAFDPFTFVAMKYAVKGNRRFRPSDKIGYFTFFANPTSAEPSVMMKMKVTKDGKVIDGGQWSPVQLAQTGPHTYLLATQFDPNSLQPGHYALEVRIRDMKADKESEAYKTGYVKTAEFDVAPQ